LSSVFLAEQIVLSQCAYLTQKAFQAINKARRIGECLSRGRFIHIHVVGIVCFFSLAASLLVEAAEFHLNVAWLDQKLGKGRFDARVLGALYGLAEQGRRRHVENSVISAAHRRSVTAMSDILAGCRKLLASAF
jgi:hypothetical protein